MANYAKCEERHAETEASTGERAPEQPPKKAWKAPVGPPPTLARELHGGDKWFWFFCPACLHHGPLALAPLAIVFGMETATVDAAKKVTCSVCGYRGATLQRPSVFGTADNLIHEPFPIELATVAYDRWLTRPTRCSAPMRSSTLEPDAAL